MELENDELMIESELIPENELIAAMETMLFMSDKPVSLVKMRTALNAEVPLETYRTLMQQLRDEFTKDIRGVEIAEIGSSFQLRTKPHMSKVLRKMVKTEPLKLTSSNMESLAIVAYKQPVTKDEIDQIRGVDSGYILHNLLEKKLIRIVGRSELPGRPMLWGTTHEFLELFSLKDLDSLPGRHEVESMIAASEVGARQAQNQLLTEFSKMVSTSTKILFDDSTVDDELQQLREEIAGIPTSTDFIEDQKRKEKEAALAAAQMTSTQTTAEGSAPTPSVTDPICPENDSKKF